MRAAVVRFSVPVLPIGLPLLPTQFGRLTRSALLIRFVPSSLVVHLQHFPAFAMVAGLMELLLSRALILPLMVQTPLCLSQELPFVLCSLAARQQPLRVLGIALPPSPRSSSLQGWQVESLHPFATPPLVDTQWLACWRTAL